LLVCETMWLALVIGPVFFWRFFFGCR